MYIVKNSAGGTAYRGKDLKKACEEATGHFGTGYVEDATGVRPVVTDYDKPDGYIVGEYGQSLNDLANENDGNA